MAALKRSTMSFRRQGSSGIVWGEGSIPLKRVGIDSARSSLTSFNSKYLPPTEEQASSSTAQQPQAEPILFYSKSTGAIETPMASYHAQRSGKRDRDKPRPSHRSRFRFGRWVKQVLS